MNKKTAAVAGVCVLPVILFAAFYFLADGFGFHTIPIILSQSMMPAALGLAMACVMPAGLMDFSTGSRLVMSAIIAGLMGSRFGIPGLLAGAFLGAMLGSGAMAVLYRYLKIPSIVVSIGAVLVFEAVTDRIALRFGGSSTVQIPTALTQFANYPKNIIVVVIACLLFYYFFYSTKLGCLVNATGNDEAMLKNMGVDVAKVKFKAFVLSGVFCFFAAIMQICYSGTVQAITNMGTMTMVFKPMMGVLIALQLVKIFDNMPLMILVGEIVIQLVFNGFITMGWSDNIQNIILGVFLILVMGISGNANKITEMLRKRKLRVPAKADN